MATLKNRKKYVEHYHDLGEAMFTNCTIPTVGDFAKAYSKKDADSIKKIETITEFTGNKKDIDESIERRNSIYSDAESKKFMNSVIAANITDITESGWFYKKLISSCDDMTIVADDCGSAGEEYACPISEEVFNYKIKNRYVVECSAGLFRRSYDTTFIPKNIGIYSTLMITEHATQASLDSMNKGVTEKLNVLLEKRIPKPADLNEAKEKIREIIDEIGDVGVDSRFYEVALLSRYRNGEFVSLQNSFIKQEDVFGAFVYSNTKKLFDKMIETGEFNANSMKTKIAFDAY